MSGFSTGNSDNFDDRRRSNVRLVILVMLWQLLLFVIDVRYGSLLRELFAMRW